MNEFEFMTKRELKGLIRQRKLGIIKKVLDKLDDFKDDDVLAIEINVKEAGDE
jgi:hypothetical protein